MIEIVIALLLECNNVDFEVFQACTHNTRWKILESLAAVYTTKGNWNGKCWSYKGEEQSITWCI